MCISHQVKGGSSYLVCLGIIDEGFFFSGNLEVIHDFANTASR